MTFCGDNYSNVNQLLLWEAHQHGQIVRERKRERDREREREGEREREIVPTRKWIDQPVIELNCVNWKGSIPNFLPAQVQKDK